MTLSTLPAFQLNIFLLYTFSLYILVEYFRIISITYFIIERVLILWIRCYINMFIFLAIFSIVYSLPKNNLFSYSLQKWTGMVYQNGLDEIWFLCYFLYHAKHLTMALSADFSSLTATKIFLFGDITAYRYFFLSKKLLILHILRFSTRYFQFIVQ